MTFSLPTLSKSVLLALSLAGPLAVLVHAQDSEFPETSDEQRTSTKLVYGLLSESRYPYRPRELDSTMAEDIFKRYLESLDPGKQFFSKADIEQFSQYKSQLASAFHDGDLKPGLAVFARYKKCVEERVGYARQLLKDGFDFKTHDKFEYNRDEAPWSENQQDLNELWRRSVMNDWLRLKLADKKDPDIRKTLDKRYLSLLKSVNEIKSEDIFQLYLNAYANAVDPHTDYFTPKTAENFSQQMSLSLQGIGAQLQKQDDMTVIREIIPGGPVALDGTLKPGDRIVGVGQGRHGTIEDVIGWRIDDVVSHIRGNKGTRVRLEYIPAESGISGAHRIVTLIRQKIRLQDQAAQSEVMTVPGQGEGSPVHRVGVIKLPGFYQDFEARQRHVADYASATRDVARLLASFKSEHLDGVVLDLRNNGGGSLDEAIELTGLFIQPGPVVQVRESRGRVSVNGNQNNKVAWDGPLAVLINRGSASASEIFAGAIQDYGRGLIIGETSFGKGTVQNIIDLDRWPHRRDQHYGQLKLTIAQFFRVSGSSTQHKGVIPDIAFPASVDATEFGESTYKNALPWTQIDPVSHPTYTQFAPLLPQLTQFHTSRIAHNREFQWWEEDVAQFRQERAKKTISLNEEERLAERRKEQAKQQERQLVRKQLGLPLDPLAEESDDGLTGNERDIAKDTAREKANKKRPDPLLNESAAILEDAIELMKRNRPIDRVAKLH